MIASKFGRGTAYSTRAITCFLAAVVLTLSLVAGARVARAGADDYPAPWRAPSAPDSLVDSWGEYSRECTSFAAFRLSSRNGFTMPFHDNAVGWGSDAQARGYSVNMTPAVGSIAWWTMAPSGHVAWVEAINGSNVTIEEYNWNFTHNYSERTIAANSVSGYIHFKDMANSASDHDPFGSLDLVQPQVGGIRVAGWAIDPDAGTAAIWVHVYVDGAFQQAVLANGYRSDLASTYPAYGGYHAFDAVIPYHWGGTHSVTVYAINTGTGANQTVGSQTAMVNYDYTVQGQVQGDFTGDGKKDVAVFYDYTGGQSKLIELIGTGAGFNNPAVVWDSGPGNWDWSHTKPMVADFNGDGKSDIAVFYDYGNAQTKLVMFLSNGTGFNAQYVTWDSGAGNFEWPRAMAAAGDFTGDGKADVAALYNYPGGQSKLLVFAGNGAGQLTPLGSPAWDSGPGNWEWSRTKLGAADMMVTARRIS